MTSNEQSHEIITQLPTSEVETCRVKTANVANHCPALKLICFIIYIYVYIRVCIYIYVQYLEWNVIDKHHLMFCSCLLCRVAYFHVFPTAALCFSRVRAQSLERLTPSRRLGEKSHQIETLRTGLRWNVWGQITHHILDPRNCSPWYYRSIAGCKTSSGGSCNWMTFSVKYP